MKKFIKFAVLATIASALLYLIKIITPTQNYAEDSVQNEAVSALKNKESISVEHKDDSATAQASLAKEDQKQSYKYKEDLLKYLKANRFEDLNDIKSSMTPMSQYAIKTFHNLSGYFRSKSAENNGTNHAVNFNYGEIKLENDVLKTKGIIEILTANGTMTSFSTMPYKVKSADIIGSINGKDGIVIKNADAYIHLIYSEELNQFAGNLYFEKKGELKFDGMFLLEESSKEQKIVE